MDAEVLQEMLNDHRRLAVDLERQYRSWDETSPGSADSSHEYELLTQAWKRLEKHEGQIVKAVTS